MAAYFVDTSFWVALIDRRDAYHAKAVEWTAKLSGTLVTSEAVLLETANTFSRPDWREKVIALIDHILTRDDVEVVESSNSLWERGWVLFRSRQDKSWSLTDCQSFVVMHEKELVQALTSDSHFRQVGFQALLLKD